MSTSLHIVQRYKCAVYLNNSAVTFMVNGQHLHAMESLTHALLLIKSLVQPKHESTSGTRRLNDLTKDALRNAQQRLATLRPQRRNQGHTPRTVCYDGSLSPCFLRHFDIDARLYTGLAIYLNDVNSDDLQGIQDIAPAILTSNFALARLYASQTNAECHRTTDNLWDSARRMLDISQAVLGIQQRTMKVNEGNMFLALVVVNNTCCVHSQRHTRDSDLEACRLELVLLQTLAREMALLTNIFVPVAGAA